jgi:Domain of unknown function (DUF4190)/Septum formation
MVAMGARFNPPPGWPPAPDGFRPDPGWQPDPSWPAAPPDWPLWIEDGQTGTSRWAIVSLVAGLLGFTVVGAVVGIPSGLRALTRIRKTGQRGKRLAIAGLSLSGFWLVMLAVVVGIGATVGTSSPGSSGSSRSPAATGVRRVGVFALATGDCFDNPAGTRSVTSVQVVPCTVAHNAQVYAKFNLPRGSRFSYPGLTKVGRLAATGCNARIGASLDRLKLPKGTSIRLLYPLPGSWLLGRRTVSCVVVSPAPDLTSSVLRVRAATG